MEKTSQFHLGEFRKQSTHTFVSETWTTITINEWPREYYNPNARFIREVICTM